MIEGAGVDANEDFIVAQMGLGDVGVVKNAGVTVVMEEDGFHERPPDAVSVSYHDMMEAPLRDGGEARRNG